MTLLRLLSKQVRNKVACCSLASLVCLGLLVIVTVATAGSAFSAEVTLEWGPSTGPNLAGYRIHYGEANAGYTSVHDAGTDTRCTVDGLEPGKTYAFAATAYDTGGNESVFSNRVVCDIPPSGDPDPGTGPDEEIIIDNGAPETLSTGKWGVSGGSDPYGSESVWSRDGATYTWTFTPTVSGTYELSMWWTEYSSRSSSVPVTIEYSSGVDTVTINQRSNGGQWNRLNQYHFQAGASYNITITAEPGPASTCADAVRFVLVETGNDPIPSPSDPAPSDPAPAAVTIDNGAPETLSTGKWGVSGGSDPYGSESVWSRDGATYTWTFTPTVSGTYELSMWWTEYSSRSSSVPVTIEYSSGVDTVTINQRSNGGQWNRLNQYHFQAGASYNITITAEPGPASTCADAVRLTFSD